MCDDIPTLPAGLEVQLEQVLAEKSELAHTNQTLLHTMETEKVYIIMHV